ncbi:tyrosine-type recombinase/integrase [Streptomyces alkaliphilus]|uniref:Tyrosine-type recombinase/integrase n=1 Tax=Streptomyces alkaliphilus TaxID=1472722 RepID=A0A7W3TEX9_9ACTN|nr:tyrosine-type recombinase/integrase [Streptomyces alkaliphilus]MBB0245280.1 tyrosine-type recombinase/integrase [Streptomyces alkaliphilus]
MPLTYDVRIYAIETRKDRRKAFRLHWFVGERKYSKSYMLRAQADGRRSELMSAVRRGEQFDTETGLPASEIRALRGAITWYEHTRFYIERKWPAAPAKSRKNYADALATITPALVTTTVGRPEPKVLRRALYGWAYNLLRWEQEPPGEVAEALRWIATHSLPVSAMEDARNMRLALDALALKLDGTPAAPKTAQRKRACLSEVLGLAVEEQYFSSTINPLTTIKWSAPRSVEEVDPGSVANPRQVRELLRGVREQGARGAHLEAFFGCLYFAAMRPAEAMALRADQCHLPDRGWGTLTLRQGTVRAGRAWTNDGRAHETRQLKARAEKDSRPVPIPPHFVTLLRRHLTTYGTAPDGRLFRTNRNGLLQETGYGEVWAAARAAVLSETEAASMLARRPYDLRHAGVSFWLSSGVDPAECARRAGHSIAVLLRVYAKVVSHTRERANTQIENALGEWFGSGEHPGKTD